MALVEQAFREHRLPFNPCQGRQDAEPETELEDFERDELLRTLCLEDWFATAEQGVPIWCY